MLNRFVIIISVISLSMIFGCNVQKRTYKDIEGIWNIEYIKIGERMINNVSVEDQTISENLGSIELSFCKDYQRQDCEFIRQLADGREIIHGYQIRTDGIQLSLGDALTSVGDLDNWFGSYDIAFEENTLIMRNSVNSIPPIASAFNGKSIEIKWIR